MEVKSFNHVEYLWDEAEANKRAGDEVSLFLYRSNILGADLRITNFGGGNIGESAELEYLVRNILAN